MNKCGRSVYGITHVLQYLFGGTCEYRYNVKTMVHHYLIKNDDIGSMDFAITNECFIYENIDVHISRMCEEYDGYMRYKYRDYVREKEK